MGNSDVPNPSGQPLKMPHGTYEFGANLVSSKVGGLWPGFSCTAYLLVGLQNCTWPCASLLQCVFALQGDMMIGRVMTDGRMSGRVK